MRRVLLNIVGSSFDGSFADQPLEFATELGPRLRAALARHGYTARPPAGFVDLDAQRLGAEVAGAIQNAEPDDLLIVHVIGHGVDRNGHVLIVGADGRTSAATSVNSWVLDASGDDEDEDPERRLDEEPKARILFLIDVCYAGRAARQAFDQHIDDERRRAWVVAGCLPTGAGYNGHFTEALVDVLGDLGGIDQHFSFPYVPLTRVVRAVRRRVLQLAEERQSYPQQVVATRVDLGAVIDVPFFPNPAHEPSLMGSIPPEFRDLVAAVDPLVDPWHFASRASGRQEHQGRLMPGTFRGRTEQLRRMTDWLTATAPTHLMVVTGSPGVGKSAAIGMLVCAGHPRLATVTDKLWWDRRAELPAAPLADLVVVHARERGLGEILRSVAHQLGLAQSTQELTPTTLREAMLRRERSPVLVLDALDETVDPVAVMAAIGTLSAAVDGRPPCRLLVGTRAGPYWPAFQPFCDEAGRLGTLVDLDAEDRDVLREALAGYVDDLLRTDPGYGTYEMVQARRFVAGHVAQVLSAPVAAEGGPRWGEFLVAGVYVNHLVRFEALGDQAAVRRRATEVPRTLPEVLDLDLAGRTTPWLLPVLKVIAHSFGAGIPLEVVVACCTRFSAHPGSRPDRSEVTAALWEARFYLRRDHEPDGTTLYRLFHQALSDHLQLRAADDFGGPAAAHGRILDAILDMVHGPATDGVAWDRAVTPPYLLRHAADHAAASGRIDDLLTDAQFLVHADAAHLSRHLRLASTPAGRVVAAVFRTSLYHHLRNGPEARRSLLALDAIRQGEATLSGRIAGVTGDLPTMAWRPTWSTGGHSSSLLHVLPAPAEITTVSLATVAARQFAAVGSQDGTVQVWDLVDGTLRAFRTAGHAPVIHMCTVSSGVIGPMVVAVTRDSRLTCWTLPDATLYSQTMVGCAPATVASHLCVPSGPAYVVVGDRAGHVHGMPVGPGDSWMRNGHMAEVTAVATTVLADGSAVAISGDHRGGVRVWDIATGTQRLRLPDLPAWVGGIACYRLRDGTDVAVVTGGAPDAVVWNLADGQAIHELCTDDEWLAPATCAMVPTLGTDVVVTGGESGVVAVHDLTGGMRRSLRGHRSWLGPAMCTTLTDGTTVVVTTGGDGTARVWDLATGTARGVLTGHTNSVTGIAHLQTDDGSDLVVTYGLDGLARLWDVSLSPTDASRSGHLDTVTSVTTASDPSGAAYVISGSRDGTVLRWDARTGTPLGLVHAAENPILTVSAGQGTDGHMVVSGDLAGILRRSTLLDSSERGVSTVAEPFRPAIVAVSCSSEPDQPFQSVICDSWGSRTQFRPGPEEDFDLRLAFGTPANGVTWLRRADDAAAIVTSTADGSAVVWDVKTAKPLYRMTAHREITCVAGMSGSDGIVVAGCRDGEVRCWRLADGEPLLALTGHTEAVTAVACTSDPEGWVVAAAAADGTIRLWRMADPAWAEVVTVPEVPRSLHFTPDGGLVAGHGWEVARFDPAPGLLA